MFKKLWVWVKEKWVAILVGLSMILGVVVVARRRQVGRLKNEIIFDAAKREIEVLQERRTVLLSQDGTKRKDIARLDGEILANKRAIIEAHEDAEGLSDANVEAEFARLGY